MKNIFIFIFTLLGLYLILDGSLSIYIYQSQSFPEHFIHLIRILIGFILIFISQRMKCLKAT